MKENICKFFKWIKDHFSLLFAVVFKLRIGDSKKQDDPKSNEEENHYDS